MVATLLTLSFLLATVLALRTSTYPSHLGLCATHFVSVGNRSSTHSIAMHLTRGCCPYWHSRRSHPYLPVDLPSAGPEQAFRALPRPPRRDCLSRLPRHPHLPPSLLGSTSLPRSGTGVLQGRAGAFRATFPVRQTALLPEAGRHMPDQPGLL